MEDIKKMYKIGRSLVGVIVEDDRFSLTTLKGRDLYESEVRMLIQKFLPEVILTGIELTQNRKNKFKIRRHVGMSGCQDTWLEFLKEDSDFPILNKGGHIHVSMNDKFNEGIKSVWLGDLVELIDLTTKIESLDEYDMKEVEIQEDFDDYEKSDLKIPEWLKETEDTEEDLEEEVVTIKETESKYESIPSECDLDEE